MVLGKSADELELGLNEIVHRWSSGTPDERPDRMELFRPSVLSAILIWSVCFFSVPATELASNWWMVLALAPVIAVLVHSVRGEAQAPATAAFGLWGLVIATIPLSAQLTTTDVPWESTFAARTAFDLLMLAGPLIIALGLKEAQVDLQDRTVSLDRFTLLGLLSLACLDLSGGLLFIGTMGIFLWQCLKPQPWRVGGLRSHCVPHPQSSILLRHGPYLPRVGHRVGIRARLNCWMVDLVGDPKLVDARADDAVHRPGTK